MLETLEGDDGGGGGGAAEDSSSTETPQLPPGIELPPGVELPEGLTPPDAGVDSSQEPEAGSGTDSDEDGGGVEAP